MKPRLWLLALLAAHAAGRPISAQPGSAPPTTAPAEPTGVAALVRDAEAVGSLVRTNLARAFLKQASRLPRIEPRTIFRDTQTREFYSPDEVERLPEERRGRLSILDVSENLYYMTKYGTPIAYARPLELLGQAGVSGLSERKVLDFGYGTVGHLRLMALNGAEAVGVDVDTFLRALYCESGDQGVVRNPGAADGRLRLMHGRWPADAATREEIGGGYDLFISKNTLKNGYLHPARPVDERMLVHLGVDEETFLRELFAALKPGGLAMIYNLCPAPSRPDEPYKPWADGRSPFKREQWESAGFRILEFDKNDDQAAREMARAFGWDRPPNAMDVEKDLFALYTLVQKPEGS